jgi:hypothetical protein
MIATLQIRLRVRVGVRLLRQPFAYMSIDRLDASKKSLVPWGFALCTRITGGSKSWY